MANTPLPSASSASGAAPPLRLGKQTLLLVAGAAIVAGLALNWSWLAAVGIAPILLSLAPCALMCGLGFCMKGGAGKSCSSGDTVAAEPPVATSRET